MPEETWGEKAGNKLEEGIEQAKAGVKDLAAKAGIGSESASSRRSTRSRTSTASRARGTASRARGTASRTVEHVGRTKEELYADATRLGIKGRSKMTKAELEKAVRRG
jgi:hypothetical protein